MSTFTLIRIRLAFIAFAAVLCLLGVQQAAAFHAFAHLADGKSSESQKHLPHAKTCDKCMVYAEVGGGAPTCTQLAFQVPSPIVVISASAFQLFQSPTLPVYSARAPPVSL